jgi:hypothetical protein
LAENVGRTSEVLLPQCVADECDRMSAWIAILFFSEDPPLRRLDSQERQVTGGHELSFYQLG